MLSTYDIISYLDFNQPKSVLDIDLDIGWYGGALARESLDLSYGRVKREEWRTIISGICFPDKTNLENPLWELYTNIEVIDNVFNLNRWGGYELVLIQKGITDQATLETLKSINKQVLELD